MKQSSYGRMAMIFQVQIPAAANTLGDLPISQVLVDRVTRYVLVGGNRYPMELVKARKLAQSPWF